ncbi:MAG: peptide deformylase [Baekduia sp.]
MAEQATPPELSPEELEALERRREALSHVRKFGDPVLRTRAREVTVFDDELRRQAGRMASLMHDAMGIGLAAPQAGVSNRLLVYRVLGEGAVRVLVNPVVDWASNEEEWMEEGCLSLPAVHVDVRRPVAITLRALDAEGEAVAVEASGLEARVIQHEIDHLDGVLILDRASREQRKEAMREMRAALAGDDDEA